MRAGAGSLDRLETVPDAEPFIGPDQAAIEALFAAMEPEAPRTEAGTERRESLPVT